MPNIRKLNQSGFDHVLLGLAVIVIFGLVGTGLLVASHAATPVVQWKGVFETFSSNSGYCLNSLGSTNASKVVLSPCTAGNTNQTWTLMNVRTGSVMGVAGVQEFELQNAAGTNECLNDPYGSKTNGVPMQLYACKTTDNNSTWVWANVLSTSGLSAHQLMNLASLSGSKGLCLDDTYGSKISGAKVQGYACKTTGQSNQSWYEDSAPGGSTGGGGTTSTGGQYWGVAPVGTTLPRSDTYCAANVQQIPERIAANATANHDTPPAGTNFNWGPWAKGTSGLASNFSHVDGNYSGTTDQIIEWASCKWGLDQNEEKAEAVVESGWRQSVAGDSGESQGILQVRDSPTNPLNHSGWGGYPWTHNSTAVDADAQMAMIRACYDGSMSYLGSAYKAGDEWGCMGTWNSGKWYDAQATNYIANVKSDLNSQAWLNQH